MYLTLDCNICGLHADVEGINEVAVIHGLLNTWHLDHQHDYESLKLYHQTAAEIHKQHLHEEGNED